MQQITFPVGDWSDDGHGQYEEFLVETALTLEHAREAHFQAEASGIKIGQICSDYASDAIDGDILKAFDDAGIAYDGIDVENMDPESIMVLWLRILNSVNPLLKLKLLPKQSAPMFTFYGFDEQKRHLHSPGYGVFFE